MKFETCASSLMQTNISKYTGIHDHVHLFLEMADTGHREEVLTYLHMERVLNPVPKLNPIL